MKLISVMAALVLFPLAHVLPAGAQETGAALVPDTVVTLPWGDWVVAILSWGGEAIVAVLLALLARLIALLPASIQQVVKTLQVEQLLSHAVDYGVNAVSGAVKGKALSADLGSKVLAEAVTYAVAQAPHALIDWMGGEEAIRRMILARLDLEAGAGAGVLLRDAA